jgi:uncharacterized protein YlxW (UPF0749 family)
MTDEIDFSNQQVVPNYNVNESADKIRVKTQVTRGTGTRDQDKIDVKVKGDDADEVVEQLNATIENLHETADTVRKMQPETEDTDE